MALRRSVVFAALAALAVAGCVQRAPAPLPEATPTFSCTPVAGGTPYPCYENQFQELDAQNKLYEEAEAVYRRLNAEDERVYRAGGVSEPTTVILDTTTGEVRESTMSTYRDILSDHTRLVSGSFDIAWIKRLPSLVKNDSVATIEVCGDISEAVMQAKGKQPYKVGQDTDERYYFLRVEGHLKAAFAEHKWVKTCTR